MYQTRKDKSKKAIKPNQKIIEAKKKKNTLLRAR